MRALLVVSAIWGVAIAYTGYVVGMVYWLGGWGLIPSLLPIFLAMVVVVAEAEL